MSTKHFSCVFLVLIGVFTRLFAMEEGMQPEKRPITEASSPQQQKLLKELVEQLLKVPSLKELAIIRIADYVAQGKILPEQLEYLPENLGPAILKLSEIGIIKRDSSGKIDDISFLTNFINLINKLENERESSELLFSFKNTMPATFNKAFQLLLGQVWIYRDFYQACIENINDNNQMISLARTGRGEYTTALQTLKRFIKLSGVDFKSFIFSSLSDEMQRNLQTFQNTKYGEYSDLMSQVGHTDDWFTMLLEVDDASLYNEILEKLNQTGFLVSQFITADHIRTALLSLRNATDRAVEADRAQINDIPIFDSGDPLLYDLASDIINAYDIAITFIPYADKTNRRMLEGAPLKSILQKLPKVSQLVKNFKDEEMRPVVFITTWEHELINNKIFVPEISYEEMVE